MHNLRAYRTSAAHTANASDSASVVDVATIDPKLGRSPRKDGIVEKEIVGKRGFAIDTIISKAFISVAVHFFNSVCRCHITSTPPYHITFDTTQVANSEENNFSECLAPNQFELINLKPREAQFQKTRGFFWRRHPPIFENVTLVARRKVHFQGFLAIFFGCSTNSKKRCFDTQEFTRFILAV